MAEMAPSDENAEQPADPAAQDANVTDGNNNIPAAPDSDGTANTSNEITPGKENTEPVEENTET